jgi:5S rRNA maturation endonuclease (ribonuclease M5)
MHTSLEAQVASYLAQISGRDGSRLQMIATTHSDLMIQYSDSSYIVDKRHAPTSVSPLNTTVDKIEKREALLRSARLGVSRWVNPILLYPLDPIVLVEGKTDKDFLERACAALGGHDRLRIISLSDLLENQDIGGVEQLRKYVQANTEAIKARAKGSPVIVLLDWDAALKVQEFQKMFKATDPFKALSWEESDANPQLDKSFRGVERFLSDRIISEAETTDTSLIATKKNGTKSVSPPDVPKLKGLLNGIVCKGIQPADCNYAAKLIAKLELLAKS